MNFSSPIGQTLDGKYNIERELGRGGMGTVYLATHLGTERPVAVKIIAPQFMQRPEFVERFRREARAAGRLRHPNVVDVTDFGFAETDSGRVAYLVMEYLDGCTLGEILDEEKNLPVSWTLDILEQVCSAVHEAHQQGIIHRDLKPDNIWLEPNQRGGYTVKVLDFGIAKVDSAGHSFSSTEAARTGGAETFAMGSASTFAGDEGSTAIHDSISPTQIVEARTLIQAPSEESEPAESNPARQTVNLTAEIDQEAVGTKILENGEAELPDGATPRLDTAPVTKDLTRVGAVLGTPLYMSPEQCRGQKLDPRSDLYSIGVIAYQMLSGEPPFRGDFTEVMACHREAPPPPLKVRKVRRKLRKVIMSALEKDPDLRPQSAASFATILRSRSEGIAGLMRRAVMIYSEHIGKFLGLSALFYIPMTLITIAIVIVTVMKGHGQIEESTANFIGAGLQLVLFFATVFTGYLIIGTNTWIVAHSIAVPLRPIRVRAALREVNKRRARLLGTGLLSTVLQLIIGAITCGIGFLVTSVLWSLVGPVVMMEKLRGWSAIKRSSQLVRRSLGTTVAAVLIMFFLPALVAGTLSFVINITAVAVDRSAEKVVVTENTAGSDTEVVENLSIDPATGKRENQVTIKTGNQPAVRFFNMDRDSRKKLTNSILESLLQILLLPIQLVMMSFTAIIGALLFIKTRQAGGEPITDLLEQFEDTDGPKKKWQERVRKRLLESGRISANSKS
ncbi:MAG: serine/threonine protein kinase [Acidobacteria bacterium]|nr:serine/threonine protein kinase [Acidobacteriota bacterium]